MTTLIFEPNVTGHHLEYLHHYYEGAMQRPNGEYIFLVTSNFLDVKDKYVWSESDHISIQFIDNRFDDCFQSMNPYILAWKTSKVLRYYVKRIKPEEVILTSLMQFIPFISFLLPKSVRVRGIMYKIYLYEQNQMSFVRLFAERFRLFVAAHSAIIDKIFVLNDSKSVKELNRIYKTDKYKFIPDPVPNVDLSKCRDLRAELDIPKENIVYLQFGALHERKGTLDILKSILLFSNDELKNKTFIFAGIQTDDCRTVFYPLLEKARQKTTVLVFDEFCSYEFLYNLCYTCDIILIPYHTTNLSSGLLGYAAVFGKPVVGPGKGLIGNIINTYKLGYQIDPVTPETIKWAILRVDINITSEYKQINTKQNFIDAII